MSAGLQQELLLNSSLLCDTVIITVIIATTMLVLSGFTGGFDARGSSVKGVSM